MTEQNQEQEQKLYFNDNLSNHAGHTMEVVEYKCGVCGETTDFMLRCIQESIDDTCYDDPSGVAREWVSGGQTSFWNDHNHTADEKLKAFAKEMELRNTPEK